MTQIYGLLIFSPGGLDTKLFKKIGERDNYINKNNPDSYRMFHYEIDEDYGDIDLQYIYNF